MSQPMNRCPQCGASVEIGARECRYCGEPLAAMPPPPAQPYQQPHQQYQQPYGQPYIQVPPPLVYVQQPIYQNSSPYNPSWPIKSKVAAGILAILVGGLGIHKFYLGKVGKGILYLLFCWTAIPGIIGLVEGIIYLTSDDHNFQMKHHVRLQ